MDIRYPPKLFGAALDAQDDPWTIELKHASIHARMEGQCLQVDPYEVVLEEIGRRGTALCPAGKFPVPSWLWPLPQPQDAALISAPHMRQFVESGGLRAEARKLQRFVAEEVLPHLPVMIGVDHSMTSGVIGALSDALGPERLGVLVLDRHFDALPLEIRMSGLTPGVAGPNLAKAADDDEYCCGNFWRYLIEDQVVKPENLLFVGVGDFPGEDDGSGQRLFRDAYLDFERRGCAFFPQPLFEGEYHNRLQRFLDDRIRTPYLYVSLDVDVGTDRCVHAARYMDGAGITRAALLEVARIVAQGCRHGRYRLAGVDAMEFNMHLIGLEIGEGELDQTVPVAVTFLETLLGAPRRVQENANERD